MRFDDFMVGQRVHAVVPDARQLACFEGTIRDISHVGRFAEVELMTDGLGPTTVRLTYATPLPARSFHEPSETCGSVFDHIARDAV